MAGLEERLRRFVVENFLYGQDNGFCNNASFLNAGMIDSTGMLELVCFVEESFNIQVQDTDLVPENLDSVENLASFIGRKQQQLAPGRSASAS